ncbi:hypothetical protein AB0E01_29850 [Nocardia vinacea]|uniref:hypothetical protein n=1 Tax=Nocardia vinacea TaxID=96468 RepID=UPI0033E363CD
MEPIFFPDDPSFWYETLRIFGHIAYGGADFGEVAVTVQRTVPGDYDSWYDEWPATADRVASAARTAHRVSARDGIAEKIACPTLVCADAEDGFFKGRPERLFAHLTCPKTLLEVTVEKGADAHCQSGAQRFAFARIYDWLDDTFDQA